MRDDIDHLQADDIAATPALRTYSRKRVSFKQCICSNWLKNVNCVLDDVEQGSKQVNRLRLWFGAFFNLLHAITDDFHILIKHLFMKTYFHMCDIKCFFRLFTYFAHAFNFNPCRRVFHYPILLVLRWIVMLLCFIILFIWAHLYMTTLTRGGGGGGDGMLLNLPSPLLSRTTVLCPSGDHFL